MKTTIAATFFAASLPFCASTLSALELTGNQTVSNFTAPTVEVGLPAESSTGISLAPGSSGPFNLGGGAGFESEITSTDGPPLNLGSFDIIINANGALAGNGAALAAFNRAAALWEARIADPIVVNISAGLASLGGSIIGSASSVVLQNGYTATRNAIVADAADESDDSVVLSLPTAGQFLATLQGASSLTGNVIGTKANFKALGFPNLDANFGTNDATITFSTDFSFDYDNSDGVGAGLIDFETVAAHEIGHALGFISAVDSVDAGDTTVDLATLDLFRFREGTNDPSTLAEFTTFPRNMTTIQAANTDEIANEWGMSRGVANGDGRQASHWLDNGISGSLIGLMDPTLATQTVILPTFADFRALDLIGYEIVPVPEPSSVAMFGMAFATLMAVRRRK